MANMNRKRTQPIRADPEFAKIIKEIKIKRVQMGKDSVLKPVNTSRLTLAMTRHPDFKKILDDILRSDLR
jgi:hypothetical protein